jgi:hypothetical protein
MTRTHNASFLLFSVYLWLFFLLSLPSIWIAFCFVLFPYYLFFFLSFSLFVFILSHSLRLVNTTRSLYVFLSSSSYFALIQCAVPIDNVHGGLFDGETFSEFSAKRRREGKSHSPLRKLTTHCIWLSFWRDHICSERSPCLASSLTYVTFPFD